MAWRAPPVGCQWFETDFSKDLVHELFGGDLHALARVELGDAHVQSLTEHGELLASSASRTTSATLGLFPARTCSSANA